MIFSSLLQKSAEPEFLLKIGLRQFRAIWCRNFVPKIKKIVRADFEISRKLTFRAGISKLTIN